MRIMIIISLLLFTNSKLHQEPDVLINDEIPKITDLEFSLENLNYVLDYYSVQHKDIVIRQFILETGWGKSYNFKERNNLFGLFNSNTNNYYKFEHWSESIKGYKDLVQYKYEKGDYYKFLKELPYAMDSNYISKLKQIKYDI